MTQWLAERTNEHLVSRNGLLDITVEYRTQERPRQYIGTSRITEVFTVHGKSIDGAKYKVLLATRGKLLALLRDVDDVLMDYTEVEKLGHSRYGGESYNKTTHVLSQ